MPAWAIATLSSTRTHKSTQMTASQFCKPRRSLPAEFRFSLGLVRTPNVFFFVPAFIFQTEKFYDLVKTLTYVTCIAFSFAAGFEMSHGRADIPVAYRACVATGAVVVRALRLGSFLFTRVLGAKKDGRFDAIKPNFVRFLLVWNIQGLWVFSGCLPTLVLNASQSGRTEFVWTDAVGGALFVFGLIGEIIADHQKRTFNNDPANHGKWIDTGLWRYSRHPNYFCEWVLQFGLFVFAASEFRDSQWVAVLSPIFIAILLTLVSGVRLLEDRADQKWGGQDAYERYKERTSTCLPLPSLEGLRLKFMPKYLI